MYSTFLHSITIYCPTTLRPSILLAFLKFLRDKSHRPMLLMNSNFNGREIYKEDNNNYFLIQEEQW